MEGVSSAQTGGERARLAPAVSLAGVPRGPKEGANVVVASRKRLGARVEEKARRYDCSPWRDVGCTIVGSVGEADAEPQIIENGVRRHLNACVNVLNSLPPWTARVSRQDCWPN